MKTTGGWLVGVVALASLMVSCRTTSAPITLESAQGSKIVVNSRWMERRLELEEYAWPRQADALHVQMRIRSKTTKDMRFEYRFRWLDKKGMEVTGTELWMPVALPAKSFHLIQALAPSPEAVDFIFDIRPPSPSTRW